MSTTRVTRHIRAPRSAVYGALVDPQTITYTLSEAADGGTDLVGLHEDLPAGVRAADNELGWSISIGKLARLVETAR